MLKQNVLKFVAASALFTAAAGAQVSSSNPDQVDFGGYKVQQTVELGYRFTRVNGSRQVYNTFINQHEGLRVLEQSLVMRSPEQTGTLFDELTLNSTGWGGDPENSMRFRASKHRLYDFSASFRRDHNYFDYNLLANPFNPPTSNPAIIVPFSPQAMYIRRRMYDFGLTLLPSSKFTVRLGYSRNRSEGPSFTGFHEGTDVLLNQPWNVQSNEFRIGFDLNVLPSTTISYDQFLAYDRNDTQYSLARFATFSLPNGTPVELGFPWNTTAGQPCAAPFLGGFVNPSCNGYFAYTRNQRVRTSIPTEQLTIKSHFNRVNLLGRLSYSSADLHSPYSESFDGLVTRTRERQFTFTGPVAARRIATTGDFGATVDLTRTLRLNESFRFDRWNIPGTWDSLGTATAGVTPSLLSPLGPTTVTADLIFSFLGQRTYMNTVQLEFNPSKHFGVHIGHRIRQRHMFKGEPFVFDPATPFHLEGPDIDVTEHSGIGGVWIRPVNSLRLNVEAEIMTADNIITRISPRQRQNYKARINFQPRRWATLSLAGITSESRNGAFDTRSRQHYRNAGFVLLLAPAERLNLDLSYNYTDAQQNAFICYNGSFLAPGTVPGGCPTFDPGNTGANNNPNWIYSIYANRVHHASGTLMVKPIKRLTANIGYGYIQSDGDNTLLNPLQPLGSIDFTYHQPLASLSLEVAPNVSLNGYWNYDEYAEGAFPGITVPRDFRDHRTVVSMKYAF